MKKTIIALLLFTFTLVDCGSYNEPQFGSIPLVSAPNENPYQQDLASRIDAEKEDKIGRSKSKDTPASELTFTPVNESIALPSDSAGFVVTKNSVAEESKGNKVDIIFYIDGYTSKEYKKCLNRFGENIFKTGFLHHLDAKADWQFSFSTFSGNKANYEYLEHSTFVFKVKDGGKARWVEQTVLKKGEHDRFTYDQVVYHSITPLFNGSRYRVGPDISVTRVADVAYDAPRYRSEKHRKDPLSGLDYLLSKEDRVRLDSNVIVFVVSGDDFAYSDEELENFRKKHSTVMFHSITPETDAGETVQLNKLVTASGGQWTSLCDDSSAGSALSGFVLDSIK